MKLITWNIQWGRGADGRVDLGRIVEEAHRFADCDVLCLQEVSSGFPDLPGADGSDQFATLARLLPGHRAICAPGLDLPQASGARRIFGNMLLSRYPVLQVLRHLLPQPVEPGKMSMQRVALEATLDTPLGVLRVTTTHLEYYSELQRLAQVARLRELHQEAYAHARHASPAKPSDVLFFTPPRGAAAILTGDFNFRPESTEHALLLRPFDDATPAWRDAWQLRHTRQTHPPTLGLYDKAQWPGEPFTSDFIFVSEDLAPRVREVRVDHESKASDHQAIALELE
ncbi:MAG TPA: endonuclease/exonuclease/phosphatase family protein [Noviherbaspirillum sp.]|nr:endonuclease/exonuclease/phosphatase family protein [Noviherbaspirillum sp.]